MEISVGDIQRLLVGKNVRMVNEEVKKEEKGAEEGKEKIGHALRAPVEGKCLEVNPIEGGVDVVFEQNMKYSFMPRLLTSNSVVGDIIIREGRRTFTVIP